MEGTIIKFTLPDGRRARATVPDLSQVAGWPDDRVLCVRVPKPPPPPPGTSSSPVRLHPTVTVEGVLEVVHASAHYTALAAAVAVGLSPLKVKPATERKSKLPLPPLNPELQWVIGAASAALAS